MLADVTGYNKEPQMPDRSGLAFTEDRDLEEYLEHPLLETWENVAASIAVMLSENF